MRRLRCALFVGNLPILLASSRISSGKLSAGTLLLATLSYKAKWYALIRSLEVKPRRRAQRKQFSLRFAR
ncbi:MAG: hypothetical protein IJN51_01440 [Alistipes sp.]|nr:hypothetical protein [Alistipes sp.]